MPKLKILNQPKEKPEAVKTMLITVLDAKNSIKNTLVTGIVNVRTQKMKKKLRLLIDKKLPPEWFNKKDNYNICVHAGDDPTAEVAGDQSSLGYFRIIWMLNNCKSIKNKKGISVFEGNSDGYTFHFVSSMR